MTDRGYRLRCAALVAVAVAVVAGCGVPERTDVVLDGPAPQRDISARERGKAPPRPEDAQDARELVSFYLRAAADGPTTAAERLRPFLMPNVNWQPGTDLIVVRATVHQVTPWPERPPRHTVSLTLEPVGVLTARGTVTPVHRERMDLEIDVVANTGPVQPEGERPSLLISTPPHGMYVLSDALGYNDNLAMYDPYTVYYWDTNGTTLIPDTRYLSRTLPDSLVPTELVKVVLSAPTEWLTIGVRSLPTGIVPRGNVVVEGGGRMVVDLSGQAATVSNLGDLGAQLAWTLRAYRPDVHTVELRIEGQPKLTVRADDYRFANAALALSRDPVRFCVAAGVVRLGCAAGPQLPVLESDANSRVVAAAVAREKQDAALVRSEPGQGRLSLWLGSVRTGQQGPQYVRSTLAATRMSRPAWLPQAGAAPPQGLVAAGGELYRFVAGQRTPVPVNTGEADNVTAVSVAPDGRRIALVADGQAYVAVLEFTGSILTVGPPRPLPTTLASVSAVGWSRTDRLVLLGQETTVNAAEGSRAALTEMTVTGVIEDRIALELGDLPVTALAVYPGHPESGSVRGPIMIEAGGLAQEVSITGLTPLTFQQPAPGTASPTATASPARITPLAPFYLD